MILESQEIWELMVISKSVRIGRKLKQTEWQNTKIQILKDDFNVYYVSELVYSSRHNYGPSVKPEQIILFSVVSVFKKKLG